MHADSPRPGQRIAGYALLAGAISLTAMAALAATLPDAAAEPSDSTPAPAAPSTTSTAGPASGTFRTDDRGYVGSAAQCDATQVAVAFGRTARALVAICVNRDGSLQYRGVRLSDQASVSMPAGRSADGAIVATNDAVTYAVSPTMLLVSEGDNVLYRDAWVEFREPRFSGDSPSSPTSTASGATTTAAPTTTVSTTTVTLAPSSAAGN